MLTASFGGGVKKKFPPRAHFHNVQHVFTLFLEDFVMLGHYRYKGRISGRMCRCVKSVCLMLFKACKVIILLLV